MNPFRLLLHLCCVAILGAAESLPDGRWMLTLEKAVPNAKDEAQDLEMVLERSAGNWTPLFSNKDRLFGLVEESDKSGGLKVLILFDALGRSNNLFKAQKPTSLNHFNLTVKVSSPSSVSGSWTSTEVGSGTLTGRILPMPTAQRPAPAVGEHPRFLLRADQVAALKAKAATPWGKSLLPLLDTETFSRSSRAVGLGLLYQITGDKTYAKRAQDLVLQDMRSGLWEAIGPIHYPAHQVMEAVYTWDLIHDACDKEFQSQLFAMLRPYQRHLDNFCDIDRGNGHPHSNWSAQYTSGVGVAALALLSDPSSFVEPVPETGIPTLSPPTEPIPEKLPVFPYDGDAKQLTKWIVAGPFDIGLGTDGLASIGGAAKAKVYDGLRFPLKIKEKESKEVNDQDGMEYIQLKNSKFKWYLIKGDDLQPLTREIEGIFRPCPAEWICSPTTYGGWPGGLYLRKASGFRSYRTWYFAAALQVPERVTVIIRFQNQQRDDPCVYIAGRKFRVNDVVQLEPGVYPVIHPITYTTFIGSHGRDEAIYHGFNLEKLPQVKIDALLSHRDTKQAFHKKCQETLAKTPYADFWPHLWLAYARAKDDAWVSNAITERGWNSAGDCYTIPSLQGLSLFAHAYANATGKGMGSPGNLGWVLPQEVARTVFTEDGAFKSSYGRGGDPYGPMAYARCFPFVDKAMQPAVGWAAHRITALAQAGKLKGENLVIDDFDPLSAAFALIFWPTPEEVRSPQGIIPLNIADHQRCAFNFRNRFKDGDDAVASITGFIHPGGDWGDAVSGEFRLAALGNQWAVRGHCGGGSIRDPANVVQLASTLEKEKPVIHPVFYRETNQSGPESLQVVTLEAKLGGNPAKRKIGKDPQPAIGSRSMLTDWSGACGAPALVILKDQLPKVVAPTPKEKNPILKTKPKGPSIEIDDALGGVSEDPKPQKIDPKNPPPPEDPLSMHRWQLVTEPWYKVSISANGFTISSTNGATLEATVLRPSKIKIWKEAFVAKTEINYNYDHRGAEIPRTIINVAGEDSFLIVMTVQRGPAPKATLNGNQITVGGQKIRDEGNTLLVGQ